MLSVGKMEAMTRIGFASRGIMYFLIGFLALSAGRAQDGAGALSYLDSGLGKLLLGLMSLGFLAYGIWRLSEALINSEGHGSDAKGVAVRLGGAVSGLIHLGLALTAMTLAFGSRGGGSSNGGPEQGAATALSMPGGQIGMTIVAALLILTGLYQLVKAVRLGFLRHLDNEAARKEWVKWTGRAGYAARGVVFSIMGVFLWRAARNSNSSQAGDMGEALSALPGTLQIIVALGLILFGIFSLVEARYRRINDPQVIEKLKAATS